VVARRGALIGHRQEREVGWTVLFAARWRSPLGPGDATNNQRAGSSFVIDARWNECISIRRGMASGLDTKQRNRIELDRTGRHRGEPRVRRATVMVINLNVGVKG
jgi:hypothetical protein